MSIIDIYFLGAALFFFAYAYFQRKNPVRAIKYPLGLGMITLAFFIFRVIEFWLGYLAIAVLILFRISGNVIFNKKSKSSNRK